MGDVVRSHVTEVPELLPCGYLVGDNNVITVSLKGEEPQKVLVESIKEVKCASKIWRKCIFVYAGVKEGSIDDLVFDTLIPKPIIQRYLNLLMEHRRIILSGPSGTGKSYLATKLAYYIISKIGQEVTDTNLASFNVDQKSSKVHISSLGYGS